MSVRGAILTTLVLLASGAAVASEATPPAATAGARAPAAKAPVEAGPAIGWVFPVFTDKEGYHLLTLRGAAAKVLGPDRIEVTDFSAYMFSGDATERVETVLLSPRATFFPKTDRATGDSAVRLIHDDVEVTAVGWTYDHGAKKVSLAHKVHVTFQTQLGDILK